MQMVLLTTGVVLLFTRIAFFTYDFVTYRQSLVRQLDTLGRAIAANGTAALAFDNPSDAKSVLAALKADPHIVAAALCSDSGSGDCEFLQQISQYVALASHQTQRYSALQHAYEDLRQSQNTIMQLDAMPRGDTLTVRTFAVPVP